MGVAVQYTTETWKAMLMMKELIRYHIENPAPNNLWGTAVQKDREILGSLMAEGKVLT